MTYRPRSRQGCRNSWSALLAVLLGALAGASTFALSTSFAGGLSIAGHSAEARAAGKPATVRIDRFDGSLSFGGLDDPTAALSSHDDEVASWSSRVVKSLPPTYEPVVDVARTRDGRTRAPPCA